MALPTEQLALLKARHDIAQVAQKLGEYLRVENHPTPRARAALLVSKELERILSDLLGEFSDMD